MVRYTGTSDPTRAFAELRPLREKVLALQGQVRPFSPDYVIFSAVTKALDTAAYHFTREPDFYSAKP